MPSFDIVSKVDPQVLDNTINTVKKEIINRFDFKDSHVQIELNKKEMSLILESDSDMKMRQMTDALVSRSVKQGLDPLAFDFSREAYQSGKHVKKEVPIRNGLKQEDAKRILKAIKESGLKVQGQIMDDIIRVNAKKIDDLQAVIRHCRSGDFGIPLQFLNMKS
ncbi:MAG TPA: YajQ family cyclic di-GMP-binding protein [Chitinophagaceae bacterium]|nr:YajQ family cyclic di-GMP-binding protein [Chitinophagaceae bacterium]